MSDCRQAHKTGDICEHGQPVDDEDEAGARQLVAVVRGKGAHPIRIVWFWLVDCQIAPGKAYRILSDEWPEAAELVAGLCPWVQTSDKVT